jgi:rubredoxin
MNNSHTIKINLSGGIISPGDMYTILVAAAKCGIKKIRFGLRQQMLLDVSAMNYHILDNELKMMDVRFEVDADLHPNIVSSYPAEEVFITNTWLSKRVYKDIFDLMDHQPQLKINVSDRNQSFTPLLTGNINWVASASQHFWHLFIRFPKTNVIYEWKDLIYTNDVARMSKHIEALILHNRDQFYGNAEVNGNLLYELMNKERYIIQPADAPAKLPAFNLPYYEGLNKQNDKYWLGIYRRDETFSVELLKDICRLCLQTNIGQLCSTPWKSLIIKNIEEKDRPAWNRLLTKHLVNVRHAANELNFQVEDNCKEGLQLKNYLVKHLNNQDTHTFGICIGIKTREKSEVFSNILVRRRPLITIAGASLFYVHDILCAKDFNPNERTGFAFSRSTPKIFLPKQLRKVLSSFYAHVADNNKRIEKNVVKKESIIRHVKQEKVYQCTHCLTIYDETIGEPENGIVAGSPFEQLPETYLCPLCEAPKKDFIAMEKAALGLHTI